jgi:hypothetical protein
VATFPDAVIPFFPAGYQPQQSDFTTWWYDNAAFLQNRVVFRARQATTATTLPASGAATVIGYDAIDEDPYSGWTGTPTFAWMPPAGYSGWYQVTTTLFTAIVGAAVDLRPSVLGSYAYTLATVQGATTHGNGAEGTFTVYLIGGQDTVQGGGAQLNAGASLLTSLTAGQQSSLEITWLAL